MPHQLYSINKARIDKAFTLENGLTSIAAPTGSGKTHAVAECIAKALMEKKRTKKKAFPLRHPIKSESERVSQPAVLPAAGT